MRTMSRLSTKPSRHKFVLKTRPPNRRYLIRSLAVAAVGLTIAFGAVLVFTRTGYKPETRELTVAQAQAVTAALAPEK